MASRAVVVAEAMDALQANMWVDALHRSGIDATTFERGAGAALGGAAIPSLTVYPVVVNSDSLGAARSVIADLGGAGVLAPYRGPRESRAHRPAAIATIVLTVVFALAFLLATKSCR